MIAARPPDKRREPLAGGSSAQYGNSGNGIVAQPSVNTQDEQPEHRSDRRNAAARPAPAARPYAVVIWGAPRREYRRYASTREADDACRALRKFGFDAHVEAVEVPR